MEAQADRVEAKLGRYTSRYETILATITRLLHDMDRVSDSNCGREIFQTLKRQIACMSDSLNKQMVHIRACQKKLVGTVDAGAHLNDWCIAAFRQAILANQMAIRVKRCSGRASKTLILLTEAAHLERQQQVETHSSASTLLDLYKKLGGELALAVGNIEAFDKAERKFGELLDSVLGSQEMDEEDRDRPDDVVSDSSSSLGHRATRSC